MVWTDYKYAGEGERAAEMLDPSVYPMTGCAQDAYSESSPTRPLAGCSPNLAVLRTQCTRLQVSVYLRKSIITLILFQSQTSHLHACMYQ